MTQANHSSDSAPEFSNTELVAVRPPQRLWAGTRYTLNALRERRDLITMLVSRDIKARYKDSVLGIFWSLVRPFAQLLIYYIALGKFLGAERSIPEFAIFIFTGLTAWGLFADVLSGSTSSIISNSGLIKKVFLPREIFPLASAGTAIFNFSVQFLILCIAVFVVGSPPELNTLFFVPAGFLLLLLFAFALGLLLAALAVYLRDLIHLVEIFLLLLFWASPVVYSYGLVHQTLNGNWLEQLYLANPITIGIMAFQKGMWSAGADQVWPEDLLPRVIIMSLICLVLIWVSQRIFARLEGNFAQEM